eukprot:6762908-Lingulodinium_polyedra.AAC.1
MPGLGQGTVSAVPVKAPPVQLIFPSDWRAARCGICGEPCESRGRALCNVCDTVSNTLRLLADHRFTQMERQAMLWSAA